MADWEAHQATHLPFRVWCQECVRGRRDNPPHRALPAQVREVPAVSLDYCFLRRAENPDKATILLTKDRDARAIRAQIVEAKGVVGEEAVEAALRGIHEFGHRDKAILKAESRRNSQRGNSGRPKLASESPGGVIKSREGEKRGGPRR